MPQWSRDRSREAARYPDERWRATCTPEDVAILLRYDHHVVQIEGRPALLLTYHLAAESAVDQRAAPSFEISFTYARGHPAGPASVQAVVDRLVFARIGDVR